MSFGVLVVPEDPTNNGYILKPLVKRILAECGKPNANVVVLPNPRTTGYEHAKALLRDEIPELYRYNMDLLLFLPDADGKDRAAEFTSLEEHARLMDVRLICCAAEQEVEVWLLAGHTGKLNVGWPEIRKDVSVKENVFDPFLAAHGNPRAAGGGRDTLMRQTLNNYSGLRDRCPELRTLEDRIRLLLAEGESVH
jgi:hypothetical protein